MTAINITDLNNAKLDVDHIAAIATSTLPTATDRIGNVKSTIQGAVDSIDASVSEVEARKDTALAVDIPAAIATVATITDRGVWATATLYSIKDILLVSGTWHVCVQQHTSGATFAGDAAYWRVYQGEIYLPAGTGAVASTVQAKLRESVSVRDFGAVGDGVTDDTVAINSAIAAVVGAGGGSVYFSAGTYLVSNSNPSAANWDNRRAIYVGVNNVHLVGAGQGATTITLANGANAHVIKFGQRADGSVAVSNCSVSGVEIDGNRANQSAPTVTDDHWSGVDISSGCESITLSDFFIHDTQYYGIGVERNGFKNIIIKNGQVTNTGADGIDIKDDDGTNRACFVTNVLVHNFGLSGALTQQAGINPRGGVTVSDVVVTGFSGDKCGIRFDGGVTASNPTGATLSNFTVIADAKDATEGVQVNSASFPQFVSVANGRIQGCDIGLDSRYARSLFSNIEASECNIGLQTFSDNQFSNVYALSCTTSGYKCRGGNNTFNNVNARLNAIGLTVDSGQSGNQFHVGTFTSNTANVSDAGTYTAISGISGISTNSSGKADFRIDAIAELTVIVPHNLSFTPLIDDITLSLQRKTVGAATCVIGYYNCYLTDATNIYCKVAITTASSSSGAEMTLKVHSVAKKALRQ